MNNLLMVVGVYKNGILSDSYTRILLVHVGGNLSDRTIVLMDLSYRVIISEMTQKKDKKNFMSVYEQKIMSFKLVTKSVILN